MSISIELGARGTVSIMTLPALEIDKFISRAWAPPSHEALEKRVGTAASRRKAFQRGSGRGLSASAPPSAEP